jgi:Tol biopolymer transport system component
MSECAKIRRLLVVQPINWSADEQAQVETHLDTCPDCAALDRVYAEQDRLIHSLPPVRFTPSQRGQLHSQIQGERKYIKMQAKLAAVLSVITTVATLVGIAGGVRLLLSASEPVVPTIAPTAVTPTERPEATLTITPTAVAPTERPEAAPSRQIIFDNGPDIFVMNEDGSALTQLTFAEDVEGRSYGPACSPDGSQIIFIRSFGIGADMLYVMNADGSNQELLADFAEIGSFSDLAWSPDGSQIGFRARAESDEDVDNWWLDIYVMDADGANLRRLTNQREMGFGASSGPAWSPDGSRIIFSTEIRGSGFLMGEGGIYVMNADGSNLRRLVDPLVMGEEWGEMTVVGDTSRRFGSPSWSPDGSRIIFNKIIGEQGSRAEGGGGSETQIFTVDANGDNLKQLTDDVMSKKHPTWSPDGEWIVFEKEVDGIVVINPDKLAGIEITSPVMWMWNPRWMSPQAPPLVEDGSREIVLRSQSPFEEYAVVPASQVLAINPIFSDADEATMFEVGGHVHSTFDFPVDTMRYAGMTWVKAQVYYPFSSDPYDPYKIIRVAHLNGFKVQLTVLGTPEMVAQPDFERWDLGNFAFWVSNLAHFGADAIEVWNEPNIDREWQAGHISPQAYTD